MYTLIGTPAARPFRVLWALEELAQAYDIVPAKPQSKEALEYNPAGKVPILLDGSEPIIDSVAICLLYTSPSPRDGLLSRMPSSA